MTAYQNQNVRVYLSFMRMDTYFEEKGFEKIRWVAYDVEEYSGEEYGQECTKQSPS